MSFASTSSSAGTAVRSALRLSTRSRLSAPSPLQGSSSSTIAAGTTPNRSYSAAAAVAAEPSDHPSPHFNSPSSYSSGRPSSRSNDSPNSSNPRYYTKSIYSTTTPSSAQSYLTDLLSLPPNRQFSPELSLQMLTHKSYRYAHGIRRRKFGLSESSSSSSSQTLGGKEERSIDGLFDSLGPNASEEAIEAACAPHNARLSFLGRRALVTYLAMFIHQSLASFGPGGKVGSGLVGVLSSDEPWLRGRTLEKRLEDLRHVNNLGREVGDKWRVGEVMRWDRNETSREGGHVKVKGLAVEAILGGVFTQYGSPAAQRAFHLHVLPHLAGQFRDARFTERVEDIKKGVEKEFGGGIVDA